MKVDQNYIKLQNETSGNFKSLLEAYGLIEKRKLQDINSIAIDNNSWPRIIIRQCYIEQTLKLKATCRELKFIDCYIEDIELAVDHCPTLIFQDCSVGSLSIDKATNNGGTVIIESSSNDQHTEGLSNIETLIFSGPSTTINIEDTKIGTIHAVDRLNGLQLSLLRCHITNPKDDAIRLLGNCSVTMNQTTTVEGGFEWTSSYGQLRLIESTIKKVLDIKNSLSLLTISINSSNLGALSIQNTNLGIISLFIEGAMVNNVKCRLVAFKEFWIGSSKTSLVSVNNIHLIECEVQKNSWIEIDNCPIENLELNYFHNEGDIAIMNSRISQSLTIDHTTLGTSRFQNVELNDNIRFILLNSSIIETKFYTVDWMKNHQLVETKFPTETEDSIRLQYYLSLKESYRQLKAISLSALNKFDALSFQRHEQRIQKQILRLRRETWDYLLLATNELFNNYGLSYTLPFKWLIGFHLLWFLIQIAIGGTFDYNLWNSTAPLDWNLTLKACSEFVYTLFPFHGSEYLKGQTGWPLIVDILMRLTSGYFIYYFLSATRKFHLN